MEDDLHFARLEQPTDAFRSICGTWRRAQNWTTLPQLVTCKRCRQMLRASQALGPREASREPEPARH